MQDLVRKKDQKKGKMKEAKKRARNEAKAKKKARNPLGRNMEIEEGNFRKVIVMMTTKVIQKTVAKVVMLMKNKEGQKKL